jgi:hypothetical protein
LCSCSFFTWFQRALIPYCCIVGAPRLNNGSEVLVPVVLGEDANISVTILANPAPSAFELTRNGENMEVNETRVSPAGFWGRAIFF